MTSDPLREEAERIVSTHNCAMCGFPCDCPGDPCLDCERCNYEADAWAEKRHRWQ